MTNNEPVNIIKSVSVPAEWDEAFAYTRATILKNVKDLEEQIKLSQTKYELEIFEEALALEVAKMRALNI